MKNTFIGIILGISIILNIAGVTDISNIITVKPSRPLDTKVFSVRSMFGLEDDIKSYIDQMILRGYIVKSVAIMDDDTWSKGVVVMEKY
jgi:hypothetical protein